MNLLEEFNKEFIKRHDFYSEDLDLLYNKWPKTSFINIPEAWILPIDDMLLKMSNINIFPVSIIQKFGFLFVKYKEIPINEDITIKYNEISHNQEYLKFQSEVDYKIKNIDEDIYLYFDIDFSDINNEYNKITGPVYYN